MNRNRVSKKIKNRKSLMNFLLNYISPSNKIIILISQNLDKHVVSYQKYLSYNYKKKNRRLVVSRKKRFVA